MGNEDLSKAEEFVLLMRMHYTSTLAVSSEKSSTCGQKLQKLCKHNAGRRLSINQEHQGEHLSKRYQDDDIQAFLEEATVLDLNLKWTGMKSGSGSEHQQWQQTQTQLRRRHL